MKKSLQILPLLLGSFLMSAQVAVQPFSFNDISMAVHSDGSVYQASIDSDGLKGFLYVHQIWSTVQVTDSTTLRVSAALFGQQGTDYKPGPVSTDTLSGSFYDRVWTMSKSMVDSFRQGQYTAIPSEIIEWPGNGRQQYGEPDKLAPFVDVNKDGLYDPQDGDYPCIKGDKAVFFMFNDNKLKTQSLTLPINIEFHGMLYAFEGSGPAENTFFISYNVFNRSESDYTDFRIGVFSDFDIGDPGDDLVGTDLDHAMAYMYNAEAIDAGPIGFGAYPPASGMMVLKGPPANPFDSIDNTMDGCIDGFRDASGNCIPEDPANGIVEDWRFSSNISVANQFPNQNMTNPENATHFHGYMNGKFKNGSFMAFDTADGFLGTGNATPFMANPSLGTAMTVAYPGNTYDANGTTIHHTQDYDWFMSPNHQTDYRTVVGLGNSSFLADASFQFEIAYMIARDTVNNDRSTSALRSMAGAVRAFHNNYQNDCATTPNFSVRKQAVEKSGLKIYPNPSQSVATLEVQSEKYGDMSVRVFDVKGALVMTRSAKIVPGVQEVTLDVQQLKNGMYTLQVLVDGKMYNQKLSVLR